MVCVVGASAYLYASKSIVYDLCSTDTYAKSIEENELVYPELWVQYVTYLVSLENDSRVVN